MRNIRINIFFRGSRAFCEASQQKERRLMKKALYLSVATAALFALILTGCEEGGVGDQKIIEDYAAIPAPKNLKAIARPGANVVSWDPVADATDYEVSRRDGETGEVKKLYLTGAYVLDRVSFDNDLANNHKYTYTVIAKVAGRLRNNSASVDVTANIPDRGETATVVTAPEATAVEVKEVEGVNGSTGLEVIWPSDSLLKYSVAYTHGGGDLPLGYTLKSPELSGTTWLRQTVPLVGGKTTVKITAKWDDNNYYPQKTVTKEYTATGAPLPAVNSFNVSNYPYDGTYTLTWSKLEGATGYSVWKADGIGIGFDVNDKLVYNALGDWKAVDISGALLNGNTYTLKETVSAADASKTYLYGIIARNGTAKSTSLKTTTTDPVTSQIYNYFSSSSIVESKDANGEPQLLITVTAADGETLSLSRADTVYEYDQDGNASLKSVGAYAPVTGTPSVIGNEYTWIDNPAIRASYAYKLTVTKDANTQEIVRYKNNGSYTLSISSGISVSASPGTTEAYSIDVSLTDSLNYTDDLKVDVYQAEAADQNSFTPVTIWEKLTVTPLTFKDVTEGKKFTKGGLTPGKYYIYRIALTSDKAAGKTLYTGDSFWNSYTSTRPSVAPSVDWIVATAGANNLGIYTTSADTRLLKTKVYVATNAGTSSSPVYEKVTSIPNRIIDKVPEVGISDPSVPSGEYYYVAFTQAQLKGLNNTPTTKTYYLVTEASNGDLTALWSSHSFSVTNGTVSGF
jgi:hypothetical protein